MAKTGRGSAGGSKAGARTVAATGSLQFTRKNAMFGIAGLVCIVAGFALLAQGSITLAPILLVVGYVFLFPLAIIL